MVDSFMWPSGGGVNCNRKLTISEVYPLVIHFLQPQVVNCYNFTGACHTHRNPIENYTD